MVFSSSGFESHKGCLWGPECLSRVPVQHRVAPLTLRILLLLSSSAPFAGSSHHDQGLGRALLPALHTSEAGIKHASNKPFPFLKASRLALHHPESLIGLITLALCHGNPHPTKMLRVEVSELQYSELLEFRKFQTKMVITGRRCQGERLQPMLKSKEICSLTVLGQKSKVPHPTLIKALYALQAYFTTYILN